MPMMERWKGIYKLNEEMGELLCELGKLGPFPGGAHPDGKGPLLERVANELADAGAALEYFLNANGFDRQKFEARKHEKLLKYNTWGLSGIPIDGTDEKPYRPAQTAKVCAHGQLDSETCAECARYFIRERM